MAHASFLRQYQMEAENPLAGAGLPACVAQLLDLNFRPILNSRLSNTKAQEAKPQGPRLIPAPVLAKGPLLRPTHYIAFIFYFQGFYS